MQRPSFTDIECSVAQSLEVVGEWWSLMIVREVFFGRHRFEEMSDDLGIARNTLTNRLNRLVEEQVLERRAYSASGQRAAYHLTPRGRELYQVLVAPPRVGQQVAPASGRPAHGHGPRVRRGDHAGAGVRPVPRRGHPGEPAPPTRTVPRRRPAAPSRARPKGTGLSFAFLVPILLLAVVGPSDGGLGAGHG